MGGVLFYHCILAASQFLFFYDLPFSYCFILYCPNIVVFDLGPPKRTNHLYFKFQQPKSPKIKAYQSFPNQSTQEASCILLMLLLGFDVHRSHFSTRTSLQNYHFFSYPYLQSQNCIVGILI